jgi:hypothetical protein
MLTERSLVKCEDSSATLENKREMSMTKMALFVKIIFFPVKRSLQSFDGRFSIQIRLCPLLREG